MQSSCFLASSRLRMAIASFLTAASDMRCLWCTSKERVLRLYATRCHWLVLQKGGVGRFVVRLCFCQNRKGCFLTFFYNSFSTFRGVPGVGAGMWTVALGRSGSGRVGCGRAGIGAHGHALWEWLKPLLEHCDSDESCLPNQPRRSEEAQARTEGSAGLPPVPAWPTFVRGRGGAPALPATIVLAPSPSSGR